MHILRKSLERGQANHGWLKSYHTFSFADYFDPQHMGFRALRVINEDFVAPATGFDTHPHRDMEIVTYVLKGELEHKDSMGNGSVIRAGEVQYMCAGTGVKHSEKNPSKSTEVHLLQIWILPDQKGHTPRYGQKKFSTEEKSGKFCLIVSPDGRDGSIGIHQDASIYASILENGQKVEKDLSRTRFGWIQVAQGEVKVNGVSLSQGDALGIAEESRLTLEGNSQSPAELIYFDLA